MKRIAGVFLASIALTWSAFGASSGPQIQIIDHKVSIQADAISLGRLLHLLDQATGMTSKAPPELENRKISVRFSDLSFDDAVKRIFEGQPFDYVFLGGKGIVVTALSQTVSLENAAPPPSFAAVESNVNPQNNNPGQPFNGQNQVPGNINGTGAPVMAGAPNNGVTAAATQPAGIQTGFGPLPNPNARAVTTPQPALNGQLGVPIPTFGSSPAPPTPPSTVSPRVP
jgi:hypothetical protein